MLAYLFWHCPQPEVSRDEYKAELIEFHETLAKIAPRGFLGSTVYRLGRIPWLQDAEGYADWYLVEGFEGLEHLNDRAARGAGEPPHAKLARHAGPTCGGLYRMVSGRISRADRSAVAWLTRPRGVEYQPTLRNLSRRIGREASGWRRVLDLGPAPELALVGRARSEMPPPPGWQDLVLERGTVWMAPGFGARTHAWWV